MVGVAAAGCAAFSEAPPPRSDDGRLRVAAAIYPLGFVVERVAGDLADVEVLTRPGLEPHDLELAPQEAGEVATASLTVYERGFQASVDEAVDQNAAGAVIDAGAVAGLEPQSHDGHDHEEETVGTSADGEHGGVDPHFWLDPIKLAAVGDAVGAELARLDPEHADEYADGADRLRADLEAVDAAYSSGLASCARSTVVVSHDAFGYLTRYGLDFESIAGLSPGAEPTPADLGRLQELITSQGITTVFSERLVSARISASLAGDLGIDTAVLDPIEGLTDQTADEDYLALMRQNLAALRKANRCR